MIRFCSTCHQCCFIVDASRTILGKSNGSNPSTEFCHCTTRVENRHCSETQYRAALLFCCYAASKFADRRADTMDEYKQESAGPGEETVIFWNVQRGHLKVSIRLASAALGLLNVCSLAKVVFVACIFSSPLCT
jgi:hypothetical protein